MATISERRIGGNPDYPTGDGKPMAETDYHRDLMMTVIQTLEIHFQDDPEVYVSGNILLFYEPGNKRRHVSPDVLVVRGVSKVPQRLNYITWEEGKAPDVVIELTSKTTRSEDVKKKKALYRDVLQVPEYFLFDPLQDYLRPSMQGFRLAEGEYVSIEPRHGQLRSEVLGLSLGREGNALRFFDPRTGRRIPTTRERAERAEARAEIEQARADAEQARADAEQARADAEQAEARAATERADRLEAQVEALTQTLRATRAELSAEALKDRAERAEEENDRLRRELEALHRQGGGG